MKSNSRFVPIVIAVSVVCGIFIGIFFANRFAGNRLNIINTTSNKINDLLHIIDDQYVDTVDIAKIVESTMPAILAELDPHSSYISAEDSKVDDDLKKSFSGIGVQFTIKDDTVYITNIIKGGPSEKVGLCAGDRIISVNDTPYVGKIVTNNETLHRLKGEQGTTVKLGIKRSGEKKPLSFTVVRGEIPLTSIDAAYMLNEELGYIKVAKFSETTYSELLTSLAKLQMEDFKGLIIDLRGNNGGYMVSAIQMINEFLPADRLIVYTEGRKMQREDFRSDGRGSYKSLPLIVLTDELSASAAEIFAGAIQDNDRGTIVGRRTFGKGLVQQPIPFSDGSQIHLTVARYYTPSGRCIQKPYSGGDIKDYEMDLIRRYERGEFFNEDSIRQTGEVYSTRIGREVYGGGGIVPDVFVAEDTTAYTSYYSDVVSKGLIVQFCFSYTDINRAKLTELGDAESIVTYLKKNHVVEQFIKYCDSKGVKRRNNLIQRSRHLFEKAIYGSILYNIMDMEEYVKFQNKDDITIAKATELYQTGSTIPTLSKSDDKAGNKKSIDGTKKK